MALTLSPLQKTSRPTLVVTRNLATKALVWFYRTNKTTARIAALRDRRAPLPLSPGSARLAVGLARDHSEWYAQTVPLRPLLLLKTTSLRSHSIFFCFMLCSSCRCRQLRVGYLSSSSRPVCCAEPRRSEIKTSYEFS